MDAKYQYVVLCNDGTSYAVDNQAAFIEWGKSKEPRFDLGKLLASGWTPLRETAMGDGYALVLLQRVF